MQATTIAAFVSAADRAARRPILQRILDRFRAHRAKAHRALVDPRLLEDAGLAPGSEATWPRPPIA